MPTEEVFTSPLKTGVNGVVYSAMPLVRQRQHHRQVPLCRPGRQDRGGSRRKG
ncbi:MAG: aminopeptidase [Dysosmobacter sp.]